MNIFLLVRVKLNMTLVVTAAGALCRSELVFFKIFCFIFVTLISKPLMYFSFVT